MSSILSSSDFVLLTRKSSNLNNSQVVPDPHNPSSRIISHHKPVPPNIKLNGVKGTEDIINRFNADRKNDTQVEAQAGQLNNSPILGDILPAILRICSKTPNGPEK